MGGGGDEREGGGGGDSAGERTSVARAGAGDRRGWLWAAEVMLGEGGEASVAQRHAWRRGTGEDGGGRRR